MRMRCFSSAMLVFFAMVFLFGCQNPPAPAEPVIVGTPATQPEEKPSAVKPPAGPEQIDTPEIIRILEEEDVKSVGTTHSQHIGIVLTDGRMYEGTYNPKQAGKYEKIENVGFDILNLTLYIQKNRTPKPTWMIMCE